MAFSPSGIALKLNKSHLLAIWRSGQSGKVIDWLAWRCFPPGLPSVASDACAVVQISPSKRQCGEQQANLKAALVIHDLLSNYYIAGSDSLVRHDLHLHLLLLPFFYPLLCDEWWVYHHFFLLFSPPFLFFLSNLSLLDWLPFLHQRQRHLLLHCTLLHLKLLKENVLIRTDLKRLQQTRFRFLPYKIHFFFTKKWWKWSLQPP